MDLYFAGSPMDKADELIINKKCCRLFSYLNDKQGIKNYLENPNFQSKLIVDSGAFTAWTKGTQINVDDYILWLNERADKITLFGQLDAIPGDRVHGVTIDEVKQAAQQTWENYLYMRERVTNKDGLLYTYHVGEPVEFLKQALNWKDENDNCIKYIAFGGMVGKPKKQREQFLDLCFDTIKKSSNPNVKVHAFGMTDFELLEKYPITSADSTSWIMTGANGGIMTDMGIVFVSENRQYEPNYYKNISKQVTENLKYFVESYGFDLETLKMEYKQRMCFNVTYLYNKYLNIKYKPKKVKMRGLI